MVVVTSKDYNGRGVFIGSGSIFEQKHLTLPKWWIFGWPVRSGYVFTRHRSVAVGLYEKYIKTMLESDQRFSSAFNILVGLARKNNLTLICDCKYPGSWFCHGSVLRLSINEKLK